MNRTLLAAALFSASNLVLVDSAVKGTALLVLAAVAAMILRRDSAATRHLVWLLAIVAMLVVPVLSTMLPQWRVLPGWAGVPPETVVVDRSPSSIARPADGAVELPQNADPEEVERPSATAYQPAAGLPDLRPGLVTPEVIPESAVWSWNWFNALPFVWAIGFCVLILRLMAARLVLWNTERQGTVIWSSRQPAKASYDPIVTALEAVCLQLGICRPVTLLIRPDKTIPVVWGILRCRLLLPAAARHWSGEQLRSVLLHELAHIKRRDTMAQPLAQIACALHWFNPVVWFAAWRLGVEGERACDDLVLANGVRASAYAEHLLNIATKLSPARWTSACGLAMARKSSLEGRLHAVLSEKLNRRGVSVALAAIALAMTVGIAVPITMLRAADEKPGEKPKPTTTDMKPKGGEKLNSGTEEKLRWGEPVNGLRAAIVIRPALGKPTAGDLPDLYLVVQNVSDAPIRLSDNTAAPKLRELYLKRDARILAGVVSKDPTGTDVMLQPREVVFLLMFVSDWKSGDGRTSGAIFAEDSLKDTHQTMVAEMQIENAPAGAWTGKLVTGETSGAVAAGKPQPKDKEAQAIFRQWQASARTDGRIPGALIGKLGAKVRYFISLNKDDGAGHDLAVKFEKLLPRFDAAGDWTQSDAIALLDDISAIHRIPLRTTLEAAEENIIRAGEPLPAELAGAAWGQPGPVGLRVAWLLEPRAKEYPLGTSLKSRILVHNSGKKTAIFIMPSWQQSSNHTAHDAKGTAINVSSTYWTTMARKMTYRLAPGEYCETPAPGIGVGAKTEGEDWASVRVGAWIDVKQGDEVRFSPGAVEVRCSPSVVGTMMMDGRPLNVDPKDAADLWEKTIAERVERELPLPAAAAEREQIIRRVTLDLFGEAPTPEEIAAFVADDAPTARASLQKRLADRPGMAPFTGTLPPGDIQFRVLAADPDAAKKPRVATGPGYFILGDNQRLQVEQTPNGNRRTNRATIRFFSSAPKADPPGKPYEIALPEGLLTYAIAWERGAGVLWIKQKGMVRSYDFTDPAQVKETTFREPANLEKVPKSILNALPAVLDVPGAPKPAAESTGAGATPVTDDPLEREVSLAAKNVPLKTALEKVAADVGLGVEFDSEALKHVGLDLEKPVSLSFQNVPLSKALGQLIDWQSHFGVMHEVHRGKLVFTTLDAWQTRIVERLPAWIKPLYNQGLLATLDDNDEVATLTTSRVMNDDLLERLKTLPKLRELDIEVTRGITPAGLAHLAELRNLEKLTLCAVNEEGPRLGDAAIRSVVGLPALRELSIIECGMTDDGAKLLEQLPQLTTLSLYQEGRLTDAALESIGKLARLKSLSLTSYGGTQQLGRMRFSAVGIRRLGGLKELETLGLVGHEVPADALAFPKLTSLSLGHPLVDDAVATRVSQLRQLRSLILSYCGIRDSGLKQIATLPELRRLDISSGVITDEGVKAFRAHPGLEHVSLRATDVSDESLRYLAQIPTLTRLDLYGSGQTGVAAGRNFSIAGLQALKALPKLDTLYLTNFDLPGGGYIGLKEIKQLRQLSFMMCNVNDGELDALEDALPNTSITRATGYGGRLPKKLRKPLSK